MKTNQVRFTTSIDPLKIGVTLPLLGMDWLKGYLTGLGYHVLSKTRRLELRNRIITHMELKNLWNLGEDKAKFLSKRGCRKRKKLQVKKKVSRKRRKLSDDKKSESLNLVKNSGSEKAKRKIPKKKLHSKKKNSKKEEKEEKLPKRYMYPDELLFDKLIFERKGYRINPIERDGNCLFRAVADQVYCNHNLYATVRNLCANFMQEEEKYFSEFLTDSMDYTKYISDLRKDGAWGGNYEIIALSQIYKRSIEVYEHSEKPRMFQFPNNQGNNGPSIRLFYRNNHYASIKSDGVADLMFDFGRLEAGELEQQVVNLNDLSIIKKSKKYQKRIESVHDLSLLDPDTRQAIEESIAIEESEKAYLRFYASKLIQQKSNKQN